MDNPSIYAKIVSILKETKAITKSEKNQQQGFKFRGIDNVMNELHELFAKNDVFILQEVQECPTHCQGRHTVIHPCKDKVPIHDHRRLICGDGERGRSNGQRGQGYEQSNEHRTEILPIANVSHPNRRTQRPRQGHT